MSTDSLAAPTPWPKVPACYDWLSLDRRGQWRLQGQPVRHGGMTDFINRHYGRDEAGHWFVQNGPQRVYVRLDYTPWVLRRDPDGSLHTHTGAPVTAVDAVFLDGQGNLLFAFARGIGLLLDRDLPAILGELHDGHAQAVDEATLLAWLEGSSPRPALFWRHLAVAPIEAGEVAQRFAFIPVPVPAPA